MFLWMNENLTFSTLWPRFASHSLVRGQDYGDISWPLPALMGHEASGVVVEVGEGVTSLKAGDRVAMEPVSMDHLADFHIHPQEKAYKMADHVSFEEGALCEPFAVSLHAVRLAGVKAGDNVLIIGAGPIGLLAVIAAKAYDPARVVVADVKKPRLDISAQFGADGLVDTASLNPTEAAAKFTAAFDGKPIDIVIDAAGHAATVESACIAVKPAGVVQLVGIATISGDFNYMRLVTKEIDFRGAFAYGKDYPEALRLIESGKVDLKAVASHHVKMEDAQKAYEWCEKGEDDEGKAVLKGGCKVSGNNVRFGE